MHQIETFVDAIQRQGVGDQIVDVDFAVHVPIDDFRHVRATACTAECGAFPDSTSDKLERTGGDFRARRRDADDDRHAPALMGGFQRLAHGSDVADGLERVIGAALGQLDQVVDDIIAANFAGVDEMGHTKFFAERFLGIVHVDADDHVRSDHACALDNIKANAAEPEDDDVGARLHLGRVHHRAQPRGDAAADVADLVERRVFPHLGERDFWHDGKVGEGRGAHVVQDRRAVAGKPAGPIWHNALALGFADRLTQIGFRIQAVFADPAFRRIERDHVIAFLQGCHALADIDDDARAFMAEDRGEGTFRVVARQSESVRMADAGSFDFDQHLAVLGAVQLYGFDGQRLTRLAGDGGAYIHGDGSLTGVCSIIFGDSAGGRQRSVSGVDHQLAG